VNSSIGAGDSFVGGLVSGLLNGMDAQDAVCFGISAAASTLKSAGTDLCELNDVEAIHAELCGS
jgi:6-phosphofructokinase 2